MRFISKEGFLRFHIKDEIQALSEAKITIRQMKASKTSPWTAFSPRLTTTFTLNQTRCLSKARRGQASRPRASRSAGNKSSVCKWVAASS